MRAGPAAPVLVALALLHSGAAIASEPLPFTVRAEVRWAEGSGTESVRAAVERHAVRAAAEAGCVAQVIVDPLEPADLLWSVLLVELEEEVVYDDSVYGVHTPGEPGKELAYTARIRLDVVSSVAHPDRPGSDRPRKIHVADSRRPRVRGEDTAEILRADALRRVRAELGKALCRSVGRLERKRAKTGDR